MGDIAVRQQRTSRSQKIDMSSAARPYNRRARCSSPVRPGREHDATCARTHGLLVTALSRLATTLDVPTLTDLGYENAGAGLPPPGQEAQGRRTDRGCQGVQLRHPWIHGVAERANAGGAAAVVRTGGGLPCRPRPEPSLRRQWPRVLLIVVLLPADVVAAAVGVVAGEFDPQVPAPARRAEVRGFMNGGTTVVIDRLERLDHLTRTRGPARPAVGTAGSGGASGRAGMGVLGQSKQLPDRQGDRAGRFAIPLRGSITHGGRARSVLGLPLVWAPRLASTALRAPCGRSASAEQRSGGRANPPQSSPS